MENKHDFKLNIGQKNDRINGGKSYSGFAKAFIWLFCVAFCESLIGQSLNFQQLTIDQGLSNHTVHALLQDRLGFIWIGTRDGLDRYDGYECSNFLPAKNAANTVNGHAVLALLEDQKGHIWVGQRDAGITIYEPETGQFRRFPSDSNQEVDWNTITVRSIFEDNRGWIWIGTFGGGVVVFDEKEQFQHHFSTYATAERGRISNDFVFDFAQDAQGIMWIATAGKGLNGYNPTTKTHFEIHENGLEDMDGFGKSLCLADANNLWIGTSGSGLYRYNLEKKQFAHYKSAKNGLSQNIITDVSTDKIGKIWIATDGGGLNILDLGTNKITTERYNPQNSQSLNSDALYQLLFDRGGNLWIGTFNGGVNLHQVYQSPFLTNQKLANQKELGLRSVLALRAADSTRVWIGTDGGGLFLGTLNLPKINLKPVKIGESVITSLASAGNSTVWVGTFARGLSLVSEQKGIIQTFRHQENDPNSLAHDNVWALAKDKKGGLWIGTLGGGLDYLMPDRAQIQHFKPEKDPQKGLSSVQVLDILLDKNEQFLWVATESYGLNRLEIATKSWTQFHPAQGLSSDLLHCLMEDKLGRIWVGTAQNGIDILTPETGIISHLNFQIGAKSNLINSISEDKDGFIWISTQSGVVRWDENLRNFIEFDRDLDLGQNQYNPRASLISDSGWLLMGGTNGLSVLRPDQIRLDLSVPEMVWTDFKLLNQSVPIGEANNRIILTGALNDSTTIVQLSYQDRGISVAFSALDFSSPELHKFGYFLEGFDQQWNYVNAQHREATYSNLREGNYLLKIKVCGRDNIWRDSARTLRIRVSPPFWRTWWFIAFSLLATIGSIYGVVFMVLNRQKLAFKQTAMEAAQEILSLKNERLESEMVAKQAQLSATLLQTAHKNLFLTNLRTNLLSIESTDPESPAKTIRKSIREIGTEISQDDYWLQFQLVFDQTHQNFILKLRQLHPNLSQTDHRMCCLIRLQLTNSEIASILHITLNGVEQHKFRLKKKVALEKDASLNAYVMDI